MRLFRLGDRQMKEHSGLKGSKDSVEVMFFLFGKGDEKTSDFEARIDMRDIVSLISEMSFKGNSEARKIEAFLRGGSEFDAFFKTIDSDRARELEEDAKDNLAERLED